MKKSEFLKDVMVEIDSLKNHATNKEINNLNLKTFNPKKIDNCIYGQMTGNCSSNRAKVLMDKSCIRVWDVGYGVPTLLDESFSKVKSLINGENTGQMWISDNNRSYSYLSALEGYIALKGANIKGIIQYLKGDIDTLKL